MNEHNASVSVKSIICVFMLILYVSGIQRFFGDGILSLAYLILMFLIVIIMIPDIWKQGKKFIQSPKTLLLIPLGVILVFFLDNLLMENIIQAFLWKLAGSAPANSNTERVFEMIRNSPIFFFFLTCFLGPVLEEILYRYTAFGLVEKRSVWLAHIITALLFAFQHVVDAGIYGGDATQFINIGGYMVFSLIMTSIYSKTKNLCIPILIHIATNSIGVSLMLLQYN